MAASGWISDIAGWADFDGCDREAALKSTTSTAAIAKKSDPGTPARRVLRRGAEPLDPQGEIGLRLRALYSEVENEPIPSDLLNLLEKLDIAEEKSKA